MFFVNGIGFDLELVDPFDAHLRRSDGSYTLGCTSLDDGMIYVANNLSGELFDKVLCHEMVHIFCLAYGYYMDYQTEEICADFLATFGREAFDVADEILEKYMGLYNG